MTTPERDVAAELRREGEAMSDNYTPPEIEPPYLWCSGCGAKMSYGEPPHKYTDPGHSGYVAPEPPLRPSMDGAWWAAFLDGDEGVWFDRFGLWVQGKRDTAWLAERLASALLQRSPETV